MLIFTMQKMDTKLPDYFQVSRTAGRSIIKKFKDSHRVQSRGVKRRVRTVKKVSGQERLRLLRKCVLWSDETKLELSGHRGAAYVWRKNGEAYNSKNTSTNETWLWDYFSVGVLQCL